MKLVRLTALISHVDVYTAALSRALAKISSVKEVFADAFDVSAPPPFVVLPPGWQLLGQKGCSPLWGRLLATCTMSRLPMPFDCTPLQESSAMGAHGLTALACYCFA